MFDEFEQEGVITYLRYSPSLEEIDPDESETFEKIARAFVKEGEAVKKEEGRAVRVSHAKANAGLTGELIVEDGLPEELAQGLAARPGRYEAIVRFAQGPGELLPDAISTHRGMAVKLLGVEGERIPESGEEASQDFVMEARGQAFINSDAGRFLTDLRAGVSNAPAMPDAVKGAVSKAVRVGRAGLEKVGLKSKKLEFFGHPPLHPFAEAYFFQVPMRWGDFVGKVGFYPTEETIAGLDETSIKDRDDPNAFRSAMVEHFATGGAEFEMRVQLATDLKTTPVEDASKEWPEDDNPYRTVARLTLPPQPAWSEERDAYLERLSFRPANSLAAHRPLGQIMRARLYVYERLAAFRQESNGQVRACPRAAAAVPA